MPKLVSIVGVGGLGSPAALCIAAAGPDIILRLIDPDEVERSNLNRQILFSADDLGKPKVDAAAAKLAPAVCEQIRERLSPENAARLLAGSDYVIDGTDSVAAKLAINDFCIAEAIPFSYGGVRAWGGMCLAVNNPGAGGCVRCLFGTFTDDDIDQLGAACQAQGIVGAAAGVIGTLQAQATLSYFENPEALASSSLKRFEIGMSQVAESTVLPAPDCPLCSEREDAVLDLKSETCPMTFLHTKLALEKIPQGGKLRVLFGNEKSCTEVSTSCTKEGHTVTPAAHEPQTNRWEVIIERR
ncbi:MAG: ThiF family adenylyltransferase [Bdellovibrionales bacterium]|nr:ThiF family adenylyltransferase [Bdellovibrionales bacterium]